MKILVFGAGVLGCNLANNLFRAKKDTTLLARGAWAEEIRKNGLRIKRKLSLRQSVSRIPVVTALEPGDCCDVIFVAVRYTQIETILDALIGQIFASTKYKVTYEPNMGDYLLCHAAFVLPAAFACYKTDGNLKRLRGDTAYLNRLIDANIEGYRALRGAGHEILPDGDKEFEGAAYRKTCLRFFKLLRATSLGKICVCDHAMNAIGEMDALNRDLKRLFDAQGAAYPVWQELEKEAGKYLTK